MKEFTAKSGATIVINVAPWDDAKRLKGAILREVANAGVKIDKEADVSSLVSAVLTVDSSDFVDRALGPCLARCTRNSAKIVSSTFDSEEARQDYYQIIIECVMVNMRPLVDGLTNVLPASLLAMVQKQLQPSDTQKPPSMTKSDSSLPA